MSSSFFFLDRRGTYCELARTPKALNDAEVVEGHGPEEDFSGIKIT